MIEDKEYITIEEMMGLLDVTAPTIRKWMAAGMPYLQPQGKGLIRIIKGRALDWLENHNTK